MKDTPVLEILEDFAPAELHASAWAACAGKGWYFGHSSHADGGAPFWKMDLGDEAAFAALWEQARARCEELAGAPLRVIRVYANGHTYGLGGQPHADDARPGTYTLLYYPMQEWKPGWDGETVFFENGEVALSVAPKPNRAVFFDSRIAHAGRPPSRACYALRVTVAYKLEAVTTAAKQAGGQESGDTASRSPLPDGRGSDSDGRGSDSDGRGSEGDGRGSDSDGRGSEGDGHGSQAAVGRVEETGREGALRRFCIHVPAAEIEAGMEERLGALGQSVKLPGFRPGKIPVAVLRQRYGGRARREVLSRLAVEWANRATPPGGLTSALLCTAGEAQGDAVFELAITMLAELPAPDFSQIEIEKLTAADPAAAALCRDHLKQQVLDALAAAYTFPIAPALVEREFEPIWSAAQAQIGAVSSAEGEALAEEFRGIAERRIRLGAVVAETARRRGIRVGEPVPVANRGRMLEEAVIDALAAEARITERVATAEDLADLE